MEEIRRYKGAFTGQEVDERLRKVGTLETDVSDAKRDIGRLQTGLNDANSAIVRNASGLRSELTILYKEVNVVKKDITAINLRIDNLPTGGDGETGGGSVSVSDIEAWNNAVRWIEETEVDSIEVKNACDWVRLNSTSVTKGAARATALYDTISSAGYDDMNDLKEFFEDVPNNISALGQRLSAVEKGGISQDIITQEAYDGMKHEPKMYYVGIPPNDLHRIYYGEILIARKAEGGENVSAAFPLVFPIIFN